MQPVTLLGFVLFFLSGSLAQSASTDFMIEGAKKEKKLVWWTTSSTREATDFINRFNRRYPFIQVEYWKGTGEDIGEKIWAEFYAKRHTWDVALGGENRNYPEYIKAGIMQKWSVPGLEHLPKDAKDPQGYYVVMGGNVVIPAYNTKLISSREAVKSWEALVEPQWKGKLSVTTDVKAWVVLSQPGAWGKEKVREYVKRLAANKPQIIKGHTQAVTLLAAGEFPISAEVYLARVNDLKKRGAPIDWFRVSPVVFTGSSFIFSKNAPHPHAAYLWLDWLFSPEGQRAVEEITGKGNPFPGSGSQQAEAIKGLAYVARDDLYVHRNKDFAKELEKILGIE